VINENKHFFSIKMMCRVLSVSRSGYYAWKKQPESLRAQENTKLANAIKAIYDDEKQRVGSPRITKRLRASGCAIGRNRVARIMRQEGWRAKGVKKFQRNKFLNQKVNGENDSDFYFYFYLYYRQVMMDWYQ
jgi:putative transposase